MTENEAIEYMENEVRCIKQASHCDRDCLKCGLVKEEQPLLESFAVAIQALEEIQQYRALGTVEDAKQLMSEVHRLMDSEKMLVEYIKLGALEQVREAVEKMKPKKPPMDEEQNSRMLTIYVCPVCGQRIAGKGISKFCYECGQKLDWSDEE